MFRPDVTGSSLVEDRDTAQVATVPLGLVFGEFGVDGLKKRAHEGDLVHRANNGALEVVVLDCK
jgi:hypothetical protein